MGADNYGMEKRLIDFIDRSTAQQWYRDQHRESAAPAEDEYEPTRWPFTLSKSDQKFLRVQGISLK